MLTNDRTTRRILLGRLVGAPATALISGRTARAATTGRNAVDTVNDRVKRARDLRVARADALLSVPAPDHAINRDAAMLRPGIWAYSKCLPHNRLGEVDEQAYSALAKAIREASQPGLEHLPMTAPGKLADPLALYSFELEGLDPHQFVLPACPEFGSPEQAADMAEVYWQAITRDIPFSRYDSTQLIAKACADLSRFSVITAPRSNGAITPQTLFRGPAAGNLVGPYISQFLWKDIPYGSTLLKQRWRTSVPALDYGTRYEDWLSLQNGHSPERPMTYDTSQYRFIRNGRDLGTWVYKDFSYQAFLHAGLILADMGVGILSDSNPYKRSRNLAGFIEFGAAQVSDWVARVANAALKACWYQKWVLHMRIRPESFAGRIHNHLTGAGTYPIHAEMLNSAVLEHIYERHGSYLLPLAHPEGCPAHPSYPAGHASVAGACATMLKALFHENAVVADPVIATDDGLGLLPYDGPALTIGGELDKLAANISLGRDTAGVHYRSDGIQGMKLGEQVAISVLKDLIHTLPPTFTGFSFTSLDGVPVTIRRGA